MAYSLFKTLPPTISVKAFYALLIFGFIYHFLFQSVYGALLLVVLAYWYAGAYTNLDPLTLDQLVNLISTLSPEYKVALISSSLTITGFAIAFHTATINWRSQMRAQIMLQVSGEVENFFATVSRNITAAELYAKALVKVVNKIQEGASVRDAEFLVDYNHSQQQQFLDARNLLSEASVEVHRLISRNYNSLASNWGALNAAQRASVALAEVSQRMWINVPILDLNDPKRIELFVNQVNISECEEFIRTCDRSDGVMSGLTGGIRGQLQGSVLGFNFPMFSNLLSKRKEFRETVEAFHRDLNEKS
ncbi:MAG: hypothetical protein KZQ88_14885 [Candidatus Thiodiazotropha sp. (ex Dulcina madagascariensis)]|nr:hypothetical protein [Candidatus Thiodiazotropha sp. (ex Dulcina madagascariensis)]